MSEVIKQKRIFHIAKELNISHLEIIKFLKNKGVEVSSHMAPVSGDLYDDILLEFSKDKQISERYRKEQARKKVVSEIRRKENDESISTNTKKIKKIETVIKDEEFSLSKKIKSASEKLKIVKRDIEKIKLENEKDKEKLNITENKKTDIKEKKQKLISQPEVKLKIVEKEDKPKLEQPRKLKKISIEDIADKINQTRKRPDKKQDEHAKPKIQQPLPRFNKISKKKTKKKEKTLETLNIDDKKSIKVPEFTTVDELAQSMDITVQDVIKTCISLGMMVTINHRLDMDSIIMIADEYGFDIDSELDSVDDEIKYKEAEEDMTNAVERSPIVTIMGHVDHGKTSLLDYVRNENVVAGEAGGITQHIGAYEVLLKDNKKITFLDTPGHAAFTAMRSRGAQITDIVIIIIAADDDVMPQTKEAIDHAKAANVPIIIAINKIDSPNANPDKIKKSLSENNILVEDWGGKYQVQEISAKNGNGIEELLEKILLEAEVLELKANENVNAQGIVVESKLDKGLGAMATILVSKGTLNKGDIFVCGNQFGKVRALLNERNIRMSKALPSAPVQILGFDDVPKAGDIFIVYKDEKEAKKIANERSHLEREAEQRRFRKITLDQIGKQISTGETQELNLIIKGDVDGSIEALSDSLMDLSDNEVLVKIIHRSVGMITESDVSLAAASKAIIVAFNVSSSSEAKSSSKSMGVEIRTYSIIYEAIQEIKLALEGLLEPEKIEEALGYAEVREKFKIPKLGIIAGCFITQGKVVRNALLRVKRDEEVLHEGNLTSLKRFKNDVNEVLENYECGIGVDGFSDFKENDIIEVYEIKEKKRTLSKKS